MSTKVTSNGQVTIPKWVRDLLGIVPGSQIDFVRGHDGQIAVVKIDQNQKPNRLVDLRGHAGKGLSTEEIMAMTRGED
jgi:antitoxin PrlF